MIFLLVDSIGWHILLSELKSLMSDINYCGIIIVNDNKMSIKIPNNFNNNNNYH